VVGVIHLFQILFFMNTSVPIVRAIISEALRKPGNSGTVACALGIGLLDDNVEYIVCSASIKLTKLEINPVNRSNMPQYENKINCVNRSNK
jgi:hypothetical protein